MGKQRKKAGGALGDVPAAKKQIKIIDIATKAGIDVLVGGIIGGALGAFVGRWSLLGGAGVNVLGHIIKQPVVATLGVGVMASGVNDTATAVSGVGDMFGLEGAKERLISYGQGLKQKVFLDKILPAKPLSGLGEVQYFTYPSNTPVGAVDTSALDRIEAQVNANAQQFANSRQVSGLGDVYGLEGSLADPLY